MATFGGFPQSVTYQTVNVAQGGSGENLLINPRGTLNQAGEADGVLAAGRYFRDGWKAGDNGAEVYVDPDGFRLVSGSIVQVIENTLETGRTLRANMDTLYGTPQLSLGGNGDTYVVANSEHIRLEISGDNSKFTRCMVAEGVALPTYSERARADDLQRCKRYFIRFEGRLHNYVGNNGSAQFFDLPLSPELAKAPAVSYGSHPGLEGISADTRYVHLHNANGSIYVDSLTLDARL